MGLRYADQIFGACFFVTTTFKDWNEHGRRDGVYEALTDSLTFSLEKYDAKLPAFVLMPSHLHLLIIVDGKSLSSFMRDFKKFVAQKAFRDLGIHDSQVWMPRYDRVVVASEVVFRTKVEYIHANPVRSGYVTDSADWKWSSAGCYLEDRAPVVPVWKEWLW